MALMTLTAVCAMAQAEINPDHFDDNPPQAPATHNPSVRHAAPNAVAHHSQTATVTDAHSHKSAAASQSSAYQGSAAEVGNVTEPAAVNGGTSQKRQKKLVSEARHHGTS